MSIRELFARINEEAHGSPEQRLEYGNQMFAYLAERGWVSSDCGAWVLCEHPRCVQADGTPTGAFPISLAIEIQARWEIHDAKILAPSPTPGERA